MFRLPKVILIQDKHQKKKRVRGNGKNFRSFFLMSKIVQNYAKFKLYLIFGNLMKPRYVWGSWCSHIALEGGSKVSENFCPNCTF